MSALAGPFAPFTGIAGGGDPVGGFTTIGFEVPQVSPTELEAAGRSCQAHSLGLSLQADSFIQGARIAVGGWQG